ncbi:MAG: DUF1573 domain-containing protein [Bdellovibrionales bacterium]|nr:DUF1573 domain-containing protein [Bdellovibrionales bacterium]
MARKGNPSDLSSVSKFQVCRRARCQGSKQWILLFGLVIGVFLVQGSLPLSGVVYAQDDSGEDAHTFAKIEIPEPVFDFGTVAQGAKVSHDFTIRNVGTGELLLQKIVASCGCTATSSSDQKIAPGAEATVSAVFDTDGFSGEKIKTVRLYTNDPRQVSYLLTLRGTIEPEVKVEPKRVYLGEVTQGDDVSSTVRISVRDGSSITLGDYQTRSSGILVKQIESSAKSKSFVVSLSPDVKTGELRDRIVVDLKGGTQKTLNIPIYAAVQGPVRLVPRALTFGVIEGLAPIVRTVRLENDSLQMLEIKDLSIDHPAITVTHKVLKPGKRFEIQVSLDPSKVTSDVRTSLDVFTNAVDSENEKLSLSVYGVLPPK